MSIGRKNSCEKEWVGSRACTHVLSNWSRLAAYFNYHVAWVAVGGGGLARPLPALRVQLARAARPLLRRSCRVSHAARGRCDRSDFTLALLLAPPTSSAQGTFGSGFQRPPAGFFATHPMHSAAAAKPPLAPASTPATANHLWTPALRVCFCATDTRSRTTNRVRPKSHRVVFLLLPLARDFRTRRRDALLNVAYLLFGVKRKLKALPDYFVLCLAQRGNSYGKIYTALKVF